MPDSAFNRFWNTVKLPAAENIAGSPKVAEARRRQRRLIMFTLLGILVLAGGIGAFYFFSDAPQRADQELQAGMKLMGPGRYPDAIAHFNKAISIYSQLPEAYLERANAHRNLGETDAALADFQAAVELNPSLYAAQNGIAMISVEKKDFNRALQGFSKSIALHPTVDAYYQRAQIMESRGEHQKAIADYDLAIAEAPEAPFIYRARALAKAALGDLDGAHHDRDTASNLEGR